MNYEIFYERVGKSYVKKNYEKFRDFFISKALDLDDINQEVLVALWKFEKDKARAKDKEFMDIVKKKLNELKRGSQKRGTLVRNICPKCNGEYESDEDGCKYCNNKGFVIENIKTSTVSLEDLPDNLENLLVNPVINDYGLWNRIKKKCKSNDYQLLRKRFAEGYTIEELANLFNCTKQGMAKKFQKIFSLIKSIIF